MHPVSPIIGVVISMLIAHSSEAQPSATGQADCPAGTMLAPVPPANPMGTVGAMNPTGALASAAKKKLLGSKPEAKPDSVVPAKPRCLTPDEYTAEMKAQQSAALKGAATTALSATPVGMAVVGAKAAAPVAGKVAGALSGRFRRGPSKENMTKALAAGRLEVEKVSWAAGSDTPKGDSDKSIAALIEVLKASEGQFTVRVTDESDGVKAADPKLSQRRAQLITAKLLEAGIPAGRITAAPLTVTSSWDNAAPKKSEARLEIVSAAPPPPPAKQ